ncbi:hypothetical protein IWX90DRAFT_93403 [Phyllosticta citrichinensis]|uniref:Uncharacterized protein n=1 Tax=Phyllosticta citrichinensis TaxID=1130410 RepID=A0ABR1XEX5_9PEZI
MGDREGRTDGRTYQVADGESMDERRGREREERRGEEGRDEQSRAGGELLCHGMAGRGSASASIGLSPTTPPQPSFPLLSLHLCCSLLLSSALSSALSSHRTTCFATDSGSLSFLRASFFHLPSAGLALSPMSRPLRRVSDDTLTPVFCRTRSSHALRSARSDAAHLARTRDGTGTTSRAEHGTAAAGGSDGLFRGVAGSDLKS